MIRTTTLTTALLCAALLLAGCPDDKSGGGSSGPATPIHNETPLDLLKTFDQVAENEDYAAVPLVVDPAIAPQMHQMAQAMGELREAVKKTTAAVADKVGQEKADKLWSMFSVSKEADSPLERAKDEDGQIDWNKVKVTEDEAAGTATVEIDGRAQRDILFKKIDGKWYVSMPELTEANLAELQAEFQKEIDKQQERQPRLLQCLKDIEAKVADGTITADNFEFETAKMHGQARRRPN